jgi:hypothetical protein
MIKKILRFPAFIRKIDRHVKTKGLFLREDDKGMNVYALNDHKACCLLLLNDMYINFMISSALTPNLTTM